MLPPVPADVLRLEQDVIVGGRTVSTGFWLRSPTNPAMDLTTAETLFAAYLATCLPDLMGLMHTDASATTCRLYGHGFQATSFAPPNAGAWTGATELAVASGLKWTMQGSGRRAWTISYVPACPSAFVSDHWRLNETGYGTLRAQGLLLLNHLNGLPAPAGGIQQLGTVRRKTALGPLPAAQFVGFHDVFPILKLVTIGRRVPASRGLLPL